MPQLTTKSRVPFLFYRLSTILKSFKELYRLSPEKTQAFLNAYDIFDHDWADEEKLIQSMGVDYYKEIKKKLADYYSVLNHLCAIGQVEKMYIPPALDLSSSILANQVLFERRMSQDLGIKKGDKVLDIGCGRGRIASHIASITGAFVTGMNIDSTQIECAERFADGRGLSHQCQFKLADLNELPLPFADHSLDAVYHVQVFSYAKNLQKLFEDIYRILKPGGKIACLDWVHFDAYDAKNPYHADLMKRVKPLIGAIGTPSFRYYVECMKKAGFEILTSKNLSIDGLQAPLIENADRFFTRVTRLLKFFVRCKILPAHFQTLFDRLTQDGDAFVEADRLGLVTSSYYIVGEKKQ